MIDEVTISRVIVRNGLNDFLDNLEIDVAIAGAGPSGLVAARYLAEGGAKVAVFERKLSLGGGMWGGGMLYPKIVVQEEATPILDDFAINYAEDEGMYVAGSVESVAKLISHAADAGASFFNCVSIEDVIIRDSGISGVVVNWSTVEMAGLHVDPLAMKSRFCIDATGHPTELSKIVERKVGRINTPSGKIEGEGSMWAEKSESMVVDNTKEIYPNLYVTGMAANAVFGAPRMGPIFGGMLLSGKRVSELILKKI